MKNNRYYTSFEKYQFNPSIRNLENRTLSSNTINDNMSFEYQRSFYKKNYLGPYPSIEIDSSKSNKNLKTFDFNGDKFSPYYNKDYYYRDYYNKKTYHPEEYGSFNDFNYSTNWNMRPFALYYESINYKKNNNNSYSIEENIYPSNHSYYESKYSKKKKSEQKYISNNINSYNNEPKNTNYMNHIFNDKNSFSNISLNKNLNKSHILINNGNNRLTINNSPLNKKPNESYYHKIQQDKIKNSVKSTSENKRKNIIFKHSINNNESFPNNDEYNNRNTEPFIQPATPSLYFHHPINSPIKNEIKNIKNETNYNKNDKNLPSKSIENIPFKKLIFPQSKNRITIKYTKKSNISQDNKPAKIDSSKPINKENSTNTPKEIKIKNFARFYTNLNKEKNNLNNNLTININDSNEKKNIKNIQSNEIPKTSSKKEQIKEKNEIISHKSNKIVKEENNQNEKKKKSSIKAIKIVNINKTKLINSPNKTATKIIKLNQSLEKEKSKPIDKKKKLTIKQRDFEYEKKYLKEIEDVMYDNNENKFYTEPVSQIRNYYKEKKNSKNLENKDNNLNNHSKKDVKNLSKGRIVSHKETREKNIQVPKTPVPAFNRYNKSVNIELIDNKDKDKEKDDQIFHTISNLTTFDNKIKINDFAVIKNELNVFNDKSKKYKANKNIETNESVSKNDSKNNNKENFNSISIKNSNQIEKNPSKKNLSNTERLTIKTQTKIPNKKSFESKKELPKHASRVNEKRIEKNNNEKEEDEWDNIEFKGMRKKTYEPGRRRHRKNSKKEEKENSLKAQFSSTIYIKASEAMCLAGRNEYGKRKTNQDTYIIEKNVNGILNFNILGVLDGHGENGHFASQFVSRYVIYRIKNHPLIKKYDEPKEIYKQLIANGYEIIASIYLDADEQIKKEKFDVTRSGTTIVLVIQLEEHIICANTGDSRAIAIYDESYEDNLVDSKVFPLSYDCKPELPNEKKRINQFGGVVEKAYYSDDEDDDYLPYRVWAKDEDYPGLAMSRSIGDSDAKKVGVIPNPQIVEYTIDYSSKYLLIGSDGIWEFISNEEAMKIANKYYLRNDTYALCQELSQKATKLWEEKDVVVDDITILVVFF